MRSLHWHRGLADQRRESLPLHGTAGHLRVIPSTGLRHPQRDGIESHGTPGQAAECCYQLATATLRALILQSTFTSLDTFASHYWAPAFLLRDHFDNLAAVRSFPGPVLVIHGRADPVIPWKQGQLLAAAAPHASLKIYDCQHLCWDPSHLPFWQDATPFLQAAGILSRN